MNSSFALDLLLIRLVTDLADPILLLLAGIGFIIGLTLVGSAIKRLYQKYGQERQDVPDGAIWVRLIIGAVMLNLFSFMGATGASFFGSEANVTFSGLSYQGIDQDLQKRAEGAIAAVFLIVQIVGVCAFFNGLMMFVREADGKQSSGGASSKWVHLGGGILAAYIAPVVMAIQTTLGFSIIK